MEINNQLTKEQAIALYDSNIWENWTDQQIAMAQLFQDRLFVPFRRFHEAMEVALGRPVWTHEFAFRDRLINELYGDQQKPTMQDIIDLIPKDKLILIGV